MKKGIFLCSLVILTGCATKQVDSIPALDEIKTAVVGAQGKSNKIQSNTNELQKVLQEAYILNRDMSKLIDKAKSE